MPNGINTDTAPLYTIRQALVEFKDNADSVYARINGVFQYIDEQLMIVGRRRLAEIEERQRKGTDDGRTDSFACDTCGGMIMLKVMGDSTKCRESGCNGTIHRVYRDRAYDSVQRNRDVEELNELKNLMQEYRNEKGEFLNELKNFIGSNDAANAINIVSKSIMKLEEYLGLSIITETSGNGNIAFGAIVSQSNNSTDNLYDKNEVENQKPRSLIATNQSWIATNDGCQIFNTPLETGAELDSNQGKYKNYKGTCGLVSCVNVLRLSGVATTEEQLVKYASDNNLCSNGLLTSAGSKGGTTCRDREQVLEHFGINSTTKASTIDTIASAVTEGRGVIVSVYANRLWYGRQEPKGPHAVTVTSVKRNKYNDVIGFFVCDSGRIGPSSADYYSADLLEYSLTGAPVNITTSIIR